MSHLLQSFLSHLEQRPDETAFYDYDIATSYSWKNLNSICDHIGLKIQNLPVSTEYIFICTQQNILYPAALLAAWKLGLTPIPIHENFTSHELSLLEKTIGTKKYLLLLDASFENDIREKFHSICSLSLTLDSKDMQSPSPSIEAKANSSGKAIGLLTSGSTALPRLYIFSHENIFAAAQIESENEPKYKNGYICNLRPHYTSAGLNTLWPSLLHGYKNLLSEKIRRVPIARFINSMIQDQKISHLILSPTYITSLFQSSEPVLATKNKIYLYFGGSSLPLSIIEILKKNNFIPFMRYGMTEIAHIISKSDFSEKYANSVGKAFQNFEIKIEQNYFCIKSPGIASAVVENGQYLPLDNRSWFTTPDRAELDQSGHILLTGRTNEIMNINGFRFHAYQVENILRQLDIILDCRVLEVKNKLSAFILLKDNHRPVEEIEYQLKEKVREQLSPFKRPSRYVFIKNWPMASNGKIDFNTLRTLK